ncbi:MAG: alpha/beta fold hydrolase [Agathobacter sp.]
MNSKAKKIIKNSALVILISIGIIILINKLINKVANMKEHLSTENGKFYNWRYGEIFYTKKGKGSPILLIHDLHPASSAYEWNRVINRLAENHTVYALDLLGCGRSEKPNLTYTNYMYVQLINDFIANVIAKKTDVIATGASSSFVIMACQMESKFYKKIIAVSPEDVYKIAQSPTKTSNILKYLMEMPVIGSMIYNILMSKNGILDMMIDNYYYKDHLISNKLLMTYYHSAHMGDGNGKYLLSSMNSNYTNVNVIPALKRVNNSIILITGKEHEFMADIAEDYASYNPAIEVVEIANAKYLPQLETPEKFIKTINILLETQ